MSTNIDPKMLALNFMSATSFIPTNKMIARKYGLDFAVLLSETINQYKRWLEQGKLQDDMFFWTEESCEIETTLKKKKQATVFKEMEQLNLLKRHTKRLPTGKTTRYIHIHWDNVVSLMLEDDKHLRDKIKEQIKLRRDRQRIYKMNFILKRDEKNKNEDSAELLGSESWKFQNETSRKFQNETSWKFQNDPQVINKDINNNINNNNNINTYLPDLEKSKLPDSIKDILKDRVGRLVTDNIKLYEIENNFFSNEENINAYKYAETLAYCLESTREPITSFSSIMNTYINKRIERDSGTREKVKERVKKPVRTEKVFEYMDNNESQEETIDLEELRKEIENRNNK